jgi:ABC-2 type transport system ATP-binding protein
MTSPLIQTDSLTRHFRVKKETVEAVRELTLQVAEGELVALLGPNGAGKSTTLRMLTTLLPPTSGTAVVAGFDVTRDPRAVRLRIGYVGQGNAAGHSQFGRDELISQGRCYGMSPAASRTRADELITSLDLEGVADRKVSTMSGGQRRRLDIAMGLVHAPQLLFLDEPSTGLDPQSRANLQEHIRALRARHGTTVVLTTHYLDEADSMAERVIVIDHGRVIADDTPARLKATLASEQISLTIDDAGNVSRASELAARVATGGEVARDGRSLRVHVADAPAVLPGLLRALDADGVGVVRADVATPTLDDVFLNLTGRSLREGRTETASTEESDKAGSAKAAELEEVAA